MWLFRPTNLSMRALAAALLFVSVLADRAAAAELHVMNSGGFTAALAKLSSRFEQKTGDRLAVATGPSMGTTPFAIPVRLARGEPADVLIMVRGALDKLAEQGVVIKASEVDLATSRVGIAVKAGAPLPDISTVEGLKRALLDAKSIAYSDSASGVYVGSDLFRRLGIDREVSAKARMIPATPVGLIVASGKAEIGFQQISELLPIPGITVVGPIPDSVQKITTFSAGVTASAKSPKAARRLIGFLTSAEAQPTIRQTGLDPISRGVAP